MVFIAFLMVFIDSSGKKKDKWNYPPLLYEVVSKIWVCVYSEMGGLNGKIMTKRGILEGDNIAINSFTPHSSWPNSGSKFYLVQSRQSTKDRSPMQVVAAGHLSHLLPNTLLDRMSWKIYNWSILKSPLLRDKPLWVVFIWADPKKHQKTAFPIPFCHTVPKVIRLMVKFKVDHVSRAQNGALHLHTRCSLKPLW